MRVVGAGSESPGGTDAVGTATKRAEDVGGSTRLRATRNGKSMSGIDDTRHGKDFTGRFTCFALAAVLVLGGCSGSSDAGGGDQGPIVRDPPPPGGGSGPPRVDLTASTTAVPPGGSATLTWTSSNTTQCTASGGWTGSRPTQGQVTVGPLSDSTTFTLNCSGSAGNAVAMASVGILGVATLRWRAPTQNVDGSPLTDLSGYRVHYGTGSRSYTDQRSLAATATQVDIELVEGTYYFAMTALDAEGNESAYSNEVVRTVQ